MEPFVRLPVPLEQLPPCKRVRSTLLTGSLQAVRTRGMFDAYFKVLPQQFHEAMFSMVAGVWIPIELARAHYDALDVLIPDPALQIAMGRDVADRIHRTILATLAKASIGAGVTPWVGLGAFPKLWERTFDGGGVAVFKTGPKDARIDMCKLQLLETSYFRAGFIGVVAAGIELFCRKAFVTELGKRGEVRSYKLQWAG